MTMTITFDLSPEQEARLKESIARRDEASVREVLTDAIEPSVKSLLEESQNELSVEEFDSLSDQLVDEFTSRVATGTQPLSDYAVSREGIYEEHP